MVSSCYSCEILCSCSALQEDKTQLELALAESKKQVTCVQAELEKEKERTK